MRDGFDTGAARRRQWPSDEKARIVMESLRRGANISEVARRNGLSPQQLFGWRRQAHALFKEGAETRPADRAAIAPVRQARQRKEQHEKPLETPMFAPVVISAPLPSSEPAPANTGRIEIAIGDAVVRVIGPVEPSVLIAVLRAVRRTS
jgi:transposase